MLMLPRSHLLSSCARLSNERESSVNNFILLSRFQPGTQASSSWAQSWARFQFNAFGIGKIAERQKKKKKITSCIVPSRVFQSDARNTGECV